MKNGIFVEKLSNVSRFLEATRALHARGAREASWLLLKGIPGLGKSRVLTWYSERPGQKVAFVRCKANYTAHWLLSDLAEVLGVKPAHSSEKLFNAVVPELMIQANQNNMVLVFDEIDHAARDVRVLETLRDLTDAAECPLIAGGMIGAEPLMRRYKQISSRLFDVVTFLPLTVDDVRSVCEALAEIRIGEDLASEVQVRTGGQLRLVKTAIGRIEHQFRRSRDVVTLDDWRNTKKSLVDHSTQAVANA